MSAVARTRTATRSWAAAVLVALVACTLTFPSWAEEAPGENRESRAHFERAETFFNQGFFPEALEEYQAGYQKSPLPGFLINMAHCHRLMGDLHKARAYYRKYLLVLPLSARRTEVEQTIAQLDQVIANATAPAEETPAIGAGAPPRHHAQVSPTWWIWSALATSLMGSTATTQVLTRWEARVAVTPDAERILAR